MMSFCIITTVLLSLFQVSSQVTHSEKTVLVLGGTCNVGTEVVHHLLQHNYQPVLVSRGNWRLNAAKQVKPNVTHIPCERYKGRTEWLEERCPKLAEFVEDKSHIDFVIDFSSSFAEVVEEIAVLLQGKVGLYIFVSTDAVYEVCQKQTKLPIKEEDCIRPYSDVERRKLANKFKTGDGKLKIEEYLIQQRASGGFPYMILRVPDVIGPSENSAKWWRLQTWVKYYHVIKRPIHIEEDNFKSSLAYTRDVARAIRMAMKSGRVVHDQIYNIGFEKAFNYEDIIQSVVKQMKAKDVEVQEEDYCHQMYHPMSRGHLDISKIKEHLGFQPTLWTDAVKQTIDWFEQLSEEYPDQLEYIIQYFIQKIVPEENQEAFQNLFEETNIKDEL